jgi:hypothetical protein
MSEQVVETAIAPDPFGNEPTTLAEFDAYRQTGEVPERFKETPRDEQGRFKTSKPDVQESAPADAPKVEEAVNASDSAPEKPQEVDQEEVQGKGAEKRIRQLLARVKELESKTDVKPDSSTTKSDVKAESSTAKPKPSRPNIATFQGTVDEFEKAQEEYDTYLRDELRSEVTKQVTEQVLNTQLQKQIEDAEKETPGFREKAQTVVAVMNKKETAPLAEYLQRAGFVPVVKYLGEHPEELSTLDELSKTDFLEAMAETVRIHDRILKPSTKAAPAPVVKPAPKAAEKYAPIEPVGARATSKAFDVNDESLSPDEWARKRNAEIAKR